MTVTTASVQPDPPKPVPVAPGDGTMNVRTTPAPMNAVGADRYLSGREWCDPKTSTIAWVRQHKTWANSTLFGDEPGADPKLGLEPPFRSGAKDFIDALRNARPLPSWQQPSGAADPPGPLLLVTISATFRHPVRAFLMHWAYAITNYRRPVEASAKERAKDKAVATALKTAQKAAEDANAASGLADAAAQQAGLAKTPSKASAAGAQAKKAADRSRRAAARAASAANSIQAGIVTTEVYTLTDVAQANAELAKRAATDAREAADEARNAAEEMAKDEQAKVRYQYHGYSYNKVVHPQAGESPDIEDFIKSIDAGKLKGGAVGDGSNGQRSPSGKDSDTDEVKIQWWHGTVEASLSAASEMFGKMACLPALNSHHCSHKAIDITYTLLTNTRDFMVQDAQGNWRIVRYAMKPAGLKSDHNIPNIDLARIGKTYGLTKYGFQHAPDDAQQGVNIADGRPSPPPVAGSNLASGTLDTILFNSDTNPDTGEPLTANQQAAVRWKIDGLTHAVTIALELATPRKDPPKKHGAGMTAFSSMAGDVPHWSDTGG